MPNASLAAPKGLTGRPAFTAWHEYMQKKKLDDYSTENLIFWDKKFNHGSLRASFGPDKELLEQAVRSKYYQFIQQYTTLRITVPSVSEPNISETYNAAGVRTDEHGKRRFVGSVKPEEKGVKNFWVDRMKNDVQGSAARLRLFEYGWGDIHEMVNAWLQESEARETA